MIFVVSKANHSITVIQVYAPTTNAKEDEVEWFYEDLQNLLELTFKKKKKRCSFHHRGLECKSRRSRDTWSNRQVRPWSSKWSRAKSNRVLPRDCTGYSKYPLPTTLDDSTHEHHQMVNTEIRLIIFFKARDGEALYSQQRQDQELTVAQIMNFLSQNSDLSWKK